MGASIIQVLLIEDDPGDAELVMIALRECGHLSFRVTHRTTLAQGLEELGQNPGIEVALLDLSLPDSFGEKTVSRLREFAPNLPIVILSGFSDGAFSERMLRLGAQDYLEKGSVDGNAIARAIRYAITRMGQMRERAHLATLMKNIPDLVWLKDPDGVYLACNPQFERFFGAAEADIIGRTDYDFIDEGLADFFRQKDREAMRAGRPSVNEEQLTYASDGHQAVVETIKTPVFNAAGGLLGILGIARDITALKSALTAVSKFQAIVDSSDDAVIGKSLNGTITTWNHGAEKIFGYSAQEVIGKNMHLLIPAQRQKEESEILARISRGESVEHFETVRCCKDGRLIDVSVTISPIHDEKGQVVGASKIARDITERKRTEAELVKNQETLRRIVDTALDGYWLVDMQGQIIDANDAACVMLGYDRKEMLALGVFDIDVFDRPDEVQGRISRLMVNGSDRFQSRHRRKDGGEIDVEVSIRYLDLDGSISVFVRDVTELKRAEIDLRVAATAMETQEGTVIADAAGVIQRVNQAFTRITGYASEEAVGRRTNLLKSGRHDRAFYESMWDRINREGSWTGEIWNRRKSGELYPEWLSITAVKEADQKVTHYVGTFNDVTQRKEAEDQIKQLAFFDPLTGLPNRRLLLDRLTQALAASARNDREGALLFVDLDNFKMVNDTQGHEIGDLLLQQVARRLANSFREADTVARLGGDEFVLVLADLSGDSGEAATQAGIVGEKILAALGQPYELSGSQFRSTPSIGITLFGNQRGSIEDLMKQADIAMYQAKAAGRNAVRFFDPGLQATIKARASLETDLRLGIQENQILLYYQPQMDFEGRLLGAEALVRWRHSGRGLVSPAEFIPLAEETGLILAIGQRVLETGCGQIVAWAGRPETSHLTVAVNVSAKQLQRADFVEQVIDVLNRTGADPTRLKLELTESLLVENVQDVIEKMLALKAKGVGFSLDDFGTGYSSLSYLKRLPLDQLKIDQSFVRDVLTDPNDAVIAKTIVALAQSLGFGVIAEGVETSEQRDFLANSGCHIYQGYFFSRPLPLDAFEDFVQKTSLDPVVSR